MSKLSEKYNRYVIDAIDSEANTDKEKLTFLFNTFKIEYGHNLQNANEQEVLADYLAGLPSIINLPYNNSDIIELMTQMGSITSQTTEKQQEKMLDGYWSYMAMRLIQMRNRLGA